MMLFSKFRSPDRPLRGRSAKTVAAIIAASSVIAISGCSAAGSGGDGPTVVTFYSWDDATVMQPIVDAFEKSNPDIDIKVSNASDVSQYQSSLQPRLLAGTAEDIFVLGSKAEQAGGGLVMDLSNEEFVDKLSPANVSYGSHDGKLYGVSTSSWGGGFVYNSDILAEVGVKGEADFPKSWDEFLTLLGKLKDAGHTPLYESNTAGMANSLCALTGIANAAAGGNLDQQVFEGKTTWAEHWRKPFEQWQRLFDEGYETRDVVGLAGEVVNQEFATGKVAMIGTGSWAMGQLNKLDPAFDMKFMPVPGIDKDTSYLCGAASPALAINAASKVKEQAVKFLDFLTTPESANLYNKQTGSITTTEASTPVVDPALEYIVKPIQEGAIYLPIVAWPQYQDALDAESTILIQQMIAGQIEPSAVPAGLDSKLKELQR
ncbi:ABC transporter substrate-binding protein [Pseudarthrobacter oxydans]|uniref:ABC transporter substrate-binding protein n=1 Tax=Pseudarthrobacter oxydans TaxID=1671 RepID=UPI0038130AE4